MTTTRPAPSTRGTPAPPVRLAAEGVRLAYGDHVVVDDLDLALADGSFTAIVGPNEIGRAHV